MTFIQQKINFKLFDTSLLVDHIKQNNNYDLEDFLPFYVDEQQLGWISKNLLPHLQEFSFYFVRSKNQILLSSELQGFDKRTVFFDELLNYLLEKKIIDSCRDEYYGVAQSFEKSPFFKIRRGATSYFGFRNYGVHLNGFTRIGHNLYMWVAKRSVTKEVAPGKLDHIVGGGIPFGLTVRDNLYKEAQEEANIPYELLLNAKAVGALSYCRQTNLKLRRDTIFTFDLELPPSFKPINVDGEVESFYLWHIEEVIEHLLQHDSFKFNCTIVIIDFLIRHGLITPDDPHYLALINGLHTTKLDLP